MQIVGERYNSDNISSPVTNEDTIHIVLVLSVFFDEQIKWVMWKKCSCVATFQDEKPIYIKEMHCFCCLEWFMGWSTHWPWRI